MIGRRHRLGALALLTASLAGCGGPIHEVRKAEDLRANDAIVVGRIRGKLFGKPVAAWNDGPTALTLAFMDNATRKVEELEVPPDGLFACGVPAGTYGVYSQLVSRDPVQLASNLQLELFTFYLESYTVSGNDWAAHQRWSWGPNKVGPALDGTVFKMTLEPGRVYWLGDRDFEISGEAFKQGPKSFTLSTSRKNFWATEEDFKRALAAKYPWIDVSSILRAPNEDERPVVTAPRKAPGKKPDKDDGPSAPAPPPSTDEGK